MKTIRVNYIYTAINQVLMIIVPIITLPYISRIFGVAGVGLFGYTSSIASYFVLFILLGLNNYGNREIAKVKNDKERLSNTFISIFTMQVVTALIVMVIYFILMYFAFQTINELMLIWSFFIFGGAINITWFHMGLENFKMILFRNFLIKTLSVIAIFVFVKGSNAIGIYVCILSLGAIFSNVIMWTKVRKIIIFKLPTKSQVYKHILPNLKLFIPVLAVSVYTFLDKIMLGSISSMYYTGLYENSQKIITLLTGIITSLGIVMMPRITNLVSQNKNKEAREYLFTSVKWTLFLSSAFAFGLMSISKLVVIILFGEEFIEAVGLIKVFSVVIIIIAYANIIRTQILIPNERDKIYIYSVITGAIINFTLNLYLISKYNALGAVISTIVAEIFVAGFQFAFVKRDKELLRVTIDSTLFIVAGFIMFMLLSVSSIYVINNIVSLVINVFVGTIIYLILSLIILVLTKDKYLLPYIQKAGRK